MHKNDIDIKDIGLTDELWEKITVDVDKALAEKDVETLNHYLKGQVEILNLEKDTTYVENLENHSFNMFIQCQIIKNTIEQCEEAGVELPISSQIQSWSSMMEAHLSNAELAECKSLDITLPGEEFGFSQEECYSLYTKLADVCFRKLGLIN